MSLENDLSKATTGPDTPNDMKIKRQSRIAQACQVGALVFCGVALAVLIYLLGFHDRAKDIELLKRNNHDLAVIAWIMAGGVVATSLALSFVRVEGEVGGNHVHLETTGE